jgi:hypothetical protein
VKQAAVVGFVVLAAAQLVRPDRGNPPSDESRTIQAQAGTASLAAVVNRSCRDCHTNATVWPEFAKVAPLSWLMAYGVTKGREAVNFSEWASYSPEQQRLLLAVSCDDVTSGSMPGAYALLRPETRLSARDVETVCTAARKAELRSARGAR